MKKIIYQKDISPAAFFRIRMIGCLITLFAFLNIHAAYAQTFVEQHGQLRVQGNRIVDENGDPVQLRGMALYWSQWVPKYYNYNSIKWLRDDWCINVIRASIAIGSGGYSTNPDREMEKVRTVVDAAIDLGIYVIVDFHDHHAEDKLSLAQQFFRDIAQRYGDVPNILYETYNEPLNVSWSGVIKPYHEAVISTIRQYDPDNIIICGTRNWSQQVYEASQDPIDRPNIAYTLHYYAATHGQWLRDNAQRALNNGIALFVTEYGTTEASGDGYVDAEESRRWWDFLNNNYIGHCNWSVSDIEESSSALYSGASVNGGWTLDQIKPSGRLVRDELRSRCSVGYNPSPTVSITSPSDHANFTEPASVTINADASDINGTVTNVQFYNGTTLLGSDATSPYSFTWTNVSAGTYTITAKATDNEGAETTSVPVTVVVSVPQGPYSGTPVSIPGRVEAENYDLGGQGVAYNDTDIPNNGEQFRTDRVDIEETEDAEGLYNIGWTNAGEWLEYTVNVTETGIYDFNIRVAAVSADRTLRIELNGTDITGTVTVPNTGDWQAWQTVTVPGIDLNAGNNQVMRIYFITAGINLNYVDVISPSCGTPAPEVTSPVSYCQYEEATALTATGTELRWYTSPAGAGSLTAPVPGTETAGSATYYVTQTLDNCESSMASITVNINEIPEITPYTRINGGTWLQESTAGLCEGGSVTFGPQPVTSSGWAWAGPGGFTAAEREINLSDMTSQQAGIYTASYTTGGCTATQAFTVSVDPLPEALITAEGPTTFPEGGNVVLNANTGVGLTYVWYNGTQEVGTGSSYTAAEGGDYTVEVTSASGCKNTSSVTTVVVDVPTGVNWISDPEGYSNIYPNPTNGELHIEADLDLSEAELWMTDMLGAEVRIPVTVNGKEARADVSALAEGTYFLFISKDSGIIRKKITVLH